MHSLKLFSYIAALLFLTSVQAIAAEKPKGKLGYTTMGYSGAKTKSPTTFNTIIVNPKPIEPIQEIKPPSPAQEEAKQATEIWKKYKALAAGQAPKETETTKKAPAPLSSRKQAKTTHHQTTNKTPAQNTDISQRATGFAAILQQYNENKKSRAGMKSRSITPPSKPLKPALPSKAAVK